jgi:hypothetical protein
MQHEEGYEGGQSLANELGNCQQYLVELEALSRRIVSIPT